MSNASKPALTTALAWLCLGLTLGAGAAASQGVTGSPAPLITYVDQPTGIDLADYVVAWPGLEPYVARLQQGQRDAVKAQLQRLAVAPAPSDGALNLLAQLEREDGKLDSAEALIARAITSNPSQHRNHFQQAMVFFARLSRASGLGRWTWQQKTRDAYQRAFALDPRPLPYRYYLVYTLLQTPAFAGGDKDQALRLAQDGINMGQKELYVVRADVHRLRGEKAQAFADYDRAIAEQIFKLSSFLAAGLLAIDEQDRPRARQYFEWAVRCRPGNPRTHEGLGDYYAAGGDPGAATAAYEEALRIDPKSTSIREKLAKLRPPRTPR